MNINLTTQCSLPLMLLHIHHIPHGWRVFSKDWPATVALTVSDSITELSSRNAKGHERIRFLRVVFVVVGSLLVVLSVVLPALMEIATEHTGATRNFGLGYLRTLVPFITIASMATSFVAASVILSFERSRPSRTSVPLGVLTLSVLMVEVVLCAYLSAVHSQSQSHLASLTIFLLIGLVPFGLACTMFTLASMVSMAP